MLNYHLHGLDHDLDQTLIAMFWIALLVDQFDCIAVHCGSTNVHVLTGAGRTWADVVRGVPGGMAPLPPSSQVSKKQRVSGGMTPSPGLGLGFIALYYVGFH